jgi:hypothetical protein
MATYTIVPSSVPSAERSMLIEDVEVGDQIDVEEILGRPANRVQFYMTDSADVLEYKLNNLSKIKKNKKQNALSLAEEMYGVFEHDSYIKVWNSNGYPTYSVDGSEIHETVEGLKIRSISIEDLTLSTGTTISIVVW